MDSSSQVVRQPFGIALATISNDVAEAARLRDEHVVPVVLDANALLAELAWRSQRLVPTVRHDNAEPILWPCQSGLSRSLAKGAARLYGKADLIEEVRRHLAAFARDQGLDPLALNALLEADYLPALSLVDVEGIEIDDPNLALVIIAHVPAIVRVLIDDASGPQAKARGCDSIAAAGANSLLKTALAAYRAEHRTLPARVVIHKSSFHDAGEADGFSTAADDAGIEILDLVSISGSSVRLMRTGAYPVLRGTWLNLDQRDQLLYTRGSVPFFETYPGQYVPRPIRIRLDRVASTAGFLVDETLALTKMNWNNTQFDGAFPITLRAAKEVGRVLRYVPAEAPIQGSYAFYM